MLVQIALGSILMMVTTAVHALCTGGVIKGLQAMHAHHWGYQTASRRVFFVSSLVLLLFLTALLEASIWAFAYLAVGAIADLESALYFSTVTFTTLGYGDLTLDASWRLMASFQAASGIIMFGWTTALVFAVLQRMIAHESEATQAAR